MEMSTDLQPVYLDFGYRIEERKCRMFSTKTGRCWQANRLRPRKGPEELEAESLEKKQKSMKLVPKP